MLIFFSCKEKNIYTFLFESSFVLKKSDATESQEYK